MTQAGSHESSDSQDYRATQAQKTGKTVKYWLISPIGMASHQYFAVISVCFGKIYLNGRVPKICVCAQNMRHLPIV
jgi:hypothetical protein